MANVVTWRCGGRRAHLAVLVLATIGLAAAFVAVRAGGAGATTLARPVVTGIGPKRGPIAGGTVVTISGTGLPSATSVKFGAVSVGFTVGATGRITAVAPASVAGTVDITVANAAGPSATSATDQYTYLAAPVVSSVGPTSGLGSGGTVVTVNGRALTFATAVKFGGVPATNVVATSDTQLSATAPPGTGVVDVKVVTPGGTSAVSALDKFTYVVAPVVTGIGPKRGPIAGGTVVTISGTGLPSATSVKFGAVSVGFTVGATGRITAVAPASVAGTVDITVANAGGPSATSATDQYTYLAAPVVSSVGPTSGLGSGGTVVTVNGGALTFATAVKFGGAPATNVVATSDTQLSATAPPGTGVVDVKVVTPGGTSAVSALDKFTYVVAPVVSAIAPAAGPVDGGTTVSITGISLTTTSAVTFGGQAAAFALVSDSAITATAPAGAVGNVDVVVTNIAGASTPTSTTAFTYLPPSPATMPWLTFTSPTTFSHLPVGAPLTVTGGYGSLNSTVQRVTATVRDTASGAYLSPTTGAFQVDYVAYPTTMSPASGTWSMVVPALPIGSYLVQGFATDSVGARTKPEPRLFVDVPDPAASDPGMATLTLARAQWASGQSCAVFPGSVPMDVVADELDRRGLTATLTVVTNWTEQSTRTCEMQGPHASWDDIDALVHQHGWSVVSAGLGRANMPLLTPDDQLTESCGSLPVFYSHGYLQAWGLFAYGNNRFDDQTQSVVGQCYGFGRTYSGGVNISSHHSASWLQLTNSLLGGPCNNPTLACYYADISPRRYTAPDAIAAALQPAAGEWSVVQLYRFVTGAQTSGTQTWDCTSADWRDHWTASSNTGEIYCWGDFLAALDQLPAGTHFVDPATVATAWGHAPHAVVPTTDIDLGAVVVGDTATATVTVANDGTLPLHVQSFSALSAPFTVVADACTGVDVAPAASCDLTIAYPATVVGSIDGADVVITTSDAGAPPVAHVHASTIDIPPPPPPPPPPDTLPPPPPPPDPVAPGP